MLLDFIRMVHLTLLFDSEKLIRNSKKPSRVQTVYMGFTKSGYKDRREDKYNNSVNLQE